MIAARGLKFPAGVSLVAVAAALCDQLIKVLVRETVSAGSTHRIVPGLELVNIRNTGVAFGLFAGSGGTLIVGAVGVLLLLGLYFLREPDLGRFTVPLGLLAGGAIGNLIDRAWHGAVTDYLDPVLWPAFNLADVAIVAGVLGLLLEAPVKRSSESEGSSGRIRG